MENLEEIEQEENLPTQPSPKKKYLLIGVIIIILIILIGGGIIFVLLTPNEVPSQPEVKEPDVITKDETASWQTYRNEEYGFEFKYPSFYGRFPTSKPVGLTPTSMNVGLFSVLITIDRSSNFIIKVYEDQIYNIQELALFYKNAAMEEGKIVSSTKDILVEGARGTEFIVEGGESVKLKYVLWTKDRLTYEFQYGVAEHHQNKEILEKIFSTFKFVESIDTSNWQTYRNEEFGFEFKYPSHWKLEEGYDGKRYGGEDGFFQFFGFLLEGTGYIDDLSKYEAYFDGSYGSKPIIEELKIEGQEARLILPSDDQSKDMRNRAGLFIRYPRPAIIQGDTYHYFGLLADVDHMRQILSTFRFIE